MDKEMIKIKKVDFQVGNECKFFLIFLEYLVIGVMEFEVIGLIFGCFEF